MSKRFDGKVAIITGGGSGIGAAIANRLQEARRLLSLGAPPSIAASSTGFASGSAFEVEYQAVFDSTPTSDAVRLRQLSPGRLEE